MSVEVRAVLGFWISSCPDVTRGGLCAGPEGIVWMRECVVDAWAVHSVDVCSPARY